MDQLQVTPKSRKAILGILIGVPPAGDARLEHLGVVRVSRGEKQSIEAPLPNSPEAYRTTGLLE